jgi:hemin uptake protein HemP
MSTSNDALTSAMNAIPSARMSGVSGVSGVSGINTFNGLRVIDSHDLLAGQAALLIHHLGEVYRLQTTRQGKLILTK